MFITKMIMALLDEPGIRPNDPDRHMAECVRHWEQHHLPADLVDALKRADAEGGRARSHDSSSIVRRWLQAHRL